MIRLPTYFNLVYFTTFKILLTYLVTFHINISSPDPANPIEEERRVILLNAQRLSTRLGTSNKVTIGRSHNFESCHVRSPNNLQYKIMQGFSVPNVQILDDDNINCGITIYIQSEDEVGTWTLISREGGNSERRLEFTIDVNGRLSTFIK